MKQIRKISSENLQCYCNKLSKEVGDYLAGLMKTSFEAEGFLREGQICKKYLIAKSIVKYTLFFVPIMIEVVS